MTFHYLGACFVFTLAAAYSNYAKMPTGEFVALCAAVFFGVGTIRSLIREFKPKP